MVRRRPSMNDSEWFHNLENAGDISDPFENQRRVISFGKKSELPLTNFEEYEIEKNQLRETIKDAVEYLELINSSLEKKKIKLDKFNNHLQEFDKQVDSLQMNQPKSREQLNQVKYQDIKPEHVKKILQYLTQDRESIKRKMEHFTTKLGKAQTELLEKDKEISDIKAELALMEKKSKLKKKN